MPLRFRFPFRFPRALGCGLAVLILIGVSGCGGGGSGGNSGGGNSTNAPVTLTLGLPTTVTSFANADVAIAEQQGFLRDAGITLKLKNLASGVPVVQGVTGGNLDIGASSIEPVVNADIQGAGLAIIGAYADRLTAQMVTPASIGSPADLRGKPLGIQQVGAFREIMTRMVLLQAGLSPGNVKYVSVTADAYVKTLIAGRIQAAILQREQAVKALNQDPKLHVLVDLYQLRPDYFYGTYFVSRKWLASHQDVAARFLTAVMRAHRFMYDNKAATVADVAAATGFSQAVIASAYDTLVTQEAVFPVNSGLDQSRIAGTVATLAQFKILSGAAPTAASLVDTGPISTVQAKLGTMSGDPRWR